MTKNVNKFEQFALEVTKKNVVKKTSGINKKALFHEILLEKSMTKQQVVDKMTLRVFTEESGIESPDVTNSEHVEKFLKIRKTCNNSFDSISCKGQNGATYWKDERYSDYELVKDGINYRINKIK